MKRRKRESRMDIGDEDEPDIDPFLDEEWNEDYWDEEE